MKKIKGFTLMEMVIVIAVLAILTGVMIPIISSSIKSAKIKNDKVLVDNMNSIIKADEIYTGIPSSVDEVVWILVGNGFNIPEPNYKEHVFYWIPNENRIPDSNIIVIYDKEKKAIVYPENDALLNVDPVDGWYNLNGDTLEEPEGYKITYYVNGKKIKFEERTSYIKSNEEFELATPKHLDKLGEYQFSGWFVSEEALNVELEKYENNDEDTLNYLVTNKRLPNSITHIEALDEGDKVFYSSLIKITDIEDEVNIYSITYNLNGGTFTETVAKYYEGPLVEAITLSIPKRDGYTFAGWYTSSNFDSNTLVTTIEQGATGNKVYYAQWIKNVDQVSYSITYVLLGGTNPIDAPTEYDGTKTIVLPTPEREGWEFRGWYETPMFDLNGDSKIEEIKTGEIGDKTFYAYWYKERPAGTYFITYVLNGGILNNPQTEVKKGGEDVYLFTPLRRGYDFAGWYVMYDTKDFRKDTEIKVVPNTITEDITVYALWEPVEYEINYVLNGGSWVDKNKVPFIYEMDEPVTYPQEVVREGYGFLGWYETPGCQDLDCTHKGCMNFACQEPSCKDINCEHNICTNANCTHLGCKDQPVLGTLVGDTGIKTVYARWKAGVHSLIFVTYGADPHPDITNRTFTSNDEIDLPKEDIVKKLGYKFLGWYESETFEENTKIEKILIGTTESKILYAKFETISYTINYEFNGGSWENGAEGPSTYSVLDVIILDEYNAKKDYYNFGGWYTTPDFQDGTMIKSIERGKGNNALFYEADEQGNYGITLYAKWEGIKYDIPVDFDGGALFNNPVIEFAEELVDDMNASTNGITSEITQIETFKFSSNDNIGYLWGNGNKEMVDKYQWLFKFAKEEITRAYKTTAAEFEADPKGPYWKKASYSEQQYQSTMKMLDVLLSQEGEPLYEYKYDAMANKHYDNKSQKDSRDGLYNVGEYLSIDGTKKTYVDYMGDNQTLFRSWLDGLLNSSYFYAADIYRSCMIDYSLVENKAKFNALYTGTELKVETIEELPVPIKEGYVFLGWYDNDDSEGDNYLAGTRYTSTTQVHDYYSNPINEGKTLKLYAKWQKVPLYTIQFNLSGGHWEHNNLETFTEELLYYFNEKNSGITFTKGSFYKQAGTYMSNVFYDAALLNKYQWLFEYGASIINKTAASSYPSAKKLLNGITTKEYGMMDDNNINYFDSKKEAYESIPDAPGAYNAVMEWVHCIINECASPTSAASKGWIPDYSEQSNMAEFYKAYYATELTMKFYEGLTLPTPVKEGYRFVGWFDEQGNKVTESNINANMQLIAKWEANINSDEDLAAALNTAVSGDIIKINASTSGTYSGDYVINIPLIIQGPNAGIDPNTGERIEEAVFTGKFTIDANDVTIDGLAFTENAKITGTSISDIKFLNNYIYDTTSTVVTNSYADFTTYKDIETGGVIYINDGTSLTFENNKFEYLDDINIHIRGVNGATFVGNKFSNFGMDAVRFTGTGSSGEIFNSGEITFDSNEFIVTPTETYKGAYNAIFFQRYGGHLTTSISTDTTHDKFVITNNKFTNIGIVDENITLFTGAISAYHYLERKIDWTIANNIFENCVNYIAIRNNAGTSNHNYNGGIWACTVENNQFIGLPNKYYFIVRDTDETAALNPDLAVFGQNYYEDNSGNVLDSLDSTYLLQVSNGGTLLSTKPTSTIE